LLVTCSLRDFILTFGSFVFAYISLGVPFLTEYFLLSLSFLKKWIYRSIAVYSRRQRLSAVLIIPSILLTWVFEDVLFNVISVVRSARGVSISSGTQLSQSIKCHSFHGCNVSLGQIDHCSQKQDAGNATPLSLTWVCRYISGQQARKVGIISPTHVLGVKISALSNTKHLICSHP
jgi:hypothetical protein